VEAKVGKKYAIYLPKAIVKALNLAEGEKVLLSVAGGTLVLDTVQDPIRLALSGKKFASITAKQIEETSLEQQKRHAKSSP
jgi:AbrB family looped-hinge helix DNA binding protein